MRNLVFILALFIPCHLFAQETSYKKFGKISSDDFAKKVYSIDSSASAVVLFDKGSTEIVGNSKGWFSLEYKHHKRIHILKKPGYSQGDVEIPLYRDGRDEEKLINVKAVTYNLENGKIVESKLEKNNVFTDKQSKNFSKKKFTLPNVKEGSIIEFEYKVTSDFLFNLQPWAFQGSAPVLWSEYELAMPQFLGYVFLSQGYHPYHIKEQKDRRGDFAVEDNSTVSSSDRTSFATGVTDYKWVMKDVPELKEEGFTSTLRNHIAKIEFQLSEYREPLTYHNIMGSWPQVTTNLLKADYFGSALDKNNGWLSDIMQPLLATAKTDLEKAKNIYTYVRDNFTCTDYNNRYLDQTLKNLVKTKSGSVSEINLLLTAMLRYANIKADPVLLSTRSHGLVYSLYPLLNRFNYVVTQVEVDNKQIMLDASYPRLGFGKLPAQCYNGHARVVNEMATPLNLAPELIKEREITSLILSNNDKGQWMGNMQETSGYYASFNIRNKIKDKGKEEFAKDLKKSFNVEVDMEPPVIDSLDIYEEPVTVKYKFLVKPAEEDILYVNPMFGKGYKQNPFKSAERFYPVEMPYTIDETYILSMEVPKGYQVDELPKQTRVKLNEEGDASFEYLLTQSGNIISLRSRLVISKAYYLPETYEGLREFFNLIVSKHNEQIVFKKIK